LLILTLSPVFGTDGSSHLTHWGYEFLLSTYIRNLSGNDSPTSTFRRIYFFLFILAVP